MGRGASRGALLATTLLLWLAPTPRVTSGCRRDSSSDTSSRSLSLRSREATIAWARRKRAGSEWRTEHKA